MMSTTPDPSPVAGAASVEDVMDLAACRYVDFPGIGTIDLDTPKLPGNDRELLEAVMDQMFSKPMILETIASVASALHQYEGAGGSAPPAVPEAAEGVLEESAAGVDRSQPRLRPWHRRPERTTVRPCPSPQK
jgi:hypothetical protein